MVVVWVLGITRRHVLQSPGLTLQAILGTHHHADHVGGVEFCSSKRGDRLRPRNRETPQQPIRFTEGQQVQVLGLTLQVLDGRAHRWAHCLLMRRLARNALLFWRRHTVSAGVVACLRARLRRCMHRCKKLSALLRPHLGVSSA